MAARLKKSRTPLLFALFLIVFLFLRLWNLSGFLYFIYDQGRDAAKLAEMAHGSFVTLIGPTTGIEGLFLGPLWYYVGLPGFFLSGGNPVGLSVWFILISALAFPFFWWFSDVLFWRKDKEVPTTASVRELSELMGWLCLVLLTILPGSIISSTMIWNPIMAAPLMLGALYSFWRVRGATQKWKWLALGFVCAGLTLQSEFAYGVFFLPILFISIPWMTARRKLTDFVTAAIAVGATLLPQLAFELRHQFIMTTSVLHSLSDSSKSVSWARQLTNRPIQLLDVSVDFFDGPASNMWWMRLMIVFFFVIGLWSVWELSKKKRHALDISGSFYLQQLLCLFALIPYPFYLLWRGNDGNFFSYYLTPHFVFLIPLVVLGLNYVVQRLWKFSIWEKLVAGVVVLSVLLPLFVASVTHWTSTIVSPVNQAGLTSMQTAVQVAYRLRNPDRTATLVLTPNVYSVHYDYLFHWYADHNHVEPPRTVPLPDDEQMILLIENWGSKMSDYVVAQRKTLTKGWQRKRVVLSGTVTIEEWVR